MKSESKVPVADSVQKTEFPVHPKKPGGVVRILLVDDHPVVRKGLRACLSPYAHIEIVGEAADGNEALRVVRELSPDLVLMDIEMPQMNGLVATEALCKRSPKVNVLVLSMHNQSEYIVNAIQAGARGFILKQASPEELIKAIDTVQRGEPFFSWEAAWVALNNRPAGEPAPKTAELSQREEEVLVLLAAGCGNKEIAEQLQIGVRTVESHRARLMEKLNIYTIAGLTKYALAKGLISLHPAVPPTAGAPPLPRNFLHP